MAHGQQWVVAALVCACAAAEPSSGGSAASSGGLGDIPGSTSGSGDPGGSSAPASTPEPSTSTGSATTSTVGTTTGSESSADTGPPTLPGCDDDRLVLLPHEELLQELVGFGRCTTGGLGGPVVTVTNLFDSGPGSLREAIEQEGPAWIRFGVSGELYLGSKIALTSDKTVDGRGADITIRGYGLHADNGAGNVIINNLKFEGPIDDDALRLYNGGKRMWVHHCSLTGYDDGGVDTVNDVGEVTISYVHVHDVSRPFLIGANSNDNKAGGVDFTWTAHHNWYDNVTGRMPLLRFGTAHSYNNFYARGSGGGYDIDVRFGAQIVIEGNIFQPASSSGTVSNVEDACIRFEGNWAHPDANDDLDFTSICADDVLDPAEHYAYEADSADEALLEHIRGNAGWRDVPFPE